MFASIAVALLSTDAAEAANCGANNQRPCTIFERIPSCNRGLYEDFAKGRCLARAAPRPMPRCGAQGQRPCLVFERIPSCNRGLVENFAINKCVSRASPICGAEGQRPCTITERIPSCDRGLVEEFGVNKCVGGKGALLRDAERVVRDVGGLGRIILSSASCIGQPNNLAGPARRKDRVFARQMAQSRCIQNLAGIAAKEGYRTLMIGIASGGAAVLGFTGEHGFAFDTAGRLPPTFYSTIGYSGGVQGGASIGLTIGLAKGTNVAGPSGYGGDAQGFAFELAAVGGSGIGVWYDYSGRYTGVVLTATAGAKASAGAYHRIHTAVAPF